MSAAPSAADYRTDTRPARTGSEAARGRRAEPVVLARTPDARPAKTPAGIEDFLHLLARALRQLHTYPATSPLCVDAVSACHAALGNLDASERLLFVVGPRDLRMDDRRFGAGTLIEQELARRLHDVRVSTLEINRSASFRDLSRFCADLAAHPHDGDRTFAETLTEHGVEGIAVTTAQRPEVLHIGAPPPVRTQVLEQERRHRAAASVAEGPSIHLYPPDSGWIRMDPGVDLGSVSLPDLAILADDPTTLASMLQQLADDDPAGPCSPATALERKFSDVTKLFGALQPQVARVMFAKLAGAVLALDTTRRRQLLQGTVLPGLLDGEADGLILKDFPDVELADALSLLLDIETAAPELLATAVDRLDLDADRRKAMAPLLEERARARLSRANGSGESALDERTRDLIRVSGTDSKSFKEFWAYDLAIDSAAREAIGCVGPAIQATDLLNTRLDCLVHLVRLEPSPTVVERLLNAGASMLATLERAERWDDLVSCLGRLRRLAEELAEPRPDVASVILQSLAAFFDPVRTARLVQMYEAGGASASAASALVVATGASVAAPLFERLKTAERHTLERALPQILCDHASLLAPALAERLGEGTAVATGILVKMLGHAGAGYEAVLARQLEHEDENVNREALRALTRVGSAAAAAAVGVLITEAGRLQGPAEEAFWHFPPQIVQGQLVNLLQHREFVMTSPRAVSRLLDRAARTREHGLESALPSLVRLRFHFWNPPLRRVGAKAHMLLNRR